MYDIHCHSSALSAAHHTHTYIHTHTYTHTHTHRSTHTPALFAATSAAMPLEGMQSQSPQK